MPRTPGLRCVGAGERCEQQIVVLAVAHGDADAAAGHADDAAAGEESFGELIGVCDRQEEEVRVRLERCVAECAQLGGEPLALLEHRRDVRR
jgi:hypothetical protein